jgi:hypothetical protein
MNDIPFAEWLPDRAPLGVPVSTATNVIPWVDGYKAYPSFAVLSTNALTARFQGGIFGKDTASNTYDYAGDATKLYSLSTAGAWADVTRVAGGAYGTTSTQWWEFAQWGNTVIATNLADAPQVITLAGANFAALGGSPPKAAHIGIVRDFVVLGNVNDGTAEPNRVQWSAINNSASWAVSATTQADYQDLQGDGGFVQKVIGGQFGLVFQERAVWKMTYVGTPEIFQFDMLEQSKGAFAPQGVVAWGNMVFYLADDGFYVIVNGGASQPIGDGKVDKYFLSNYATGNAHRITTAIDPTNKLVMWSFPSTNSGGTPDYILVFNWQHKKWSVLSQSLEGFTRYATTGYTLEGLNNINSSIDALTTSLDDRAYTGGVTSLGAFNTSHTLGTFTGSVMAGTIDTGEVELNAAQRSTVQEVRPLVDGQAASVTIGTRNLLSDNVTWGTAIAQNASGFCPARTNANFHRFRVTTSGAFNFAQGVKIKHSGIGNGR